MADLGAGIFISEEFLYPTYIYILYMKVSLQIVFSLDLTFWNIGLSRGISISTSILIKQYNYYNYIKYLLICLILYNLIFSIIIIIIIIITIKLSYLLKILKKTLIIIN